MDDETVPRLHKKIDLEHALMGNNALILAEIIAKHPWVTTDNVISYNATAVLASADLSVGEIIGKYPWVTTDNFISYNATAALASADLSVAEVLWTSFPLDQLGFSLSLLVEKALKEFNLPVIRFFMERYPEKDHCLTNITGVVWTVLENRTNPVIYFLKTYVPHFRNSVSK